MKRWLLLAAGVAMGWGTVRAESSVWRARLGDQVVYLAGTCHMLRAEDFPLPAEFDAAYTEADTLYFETELDRMGSPEVQQVLMSEGVLLDGTTLADHVSDETWALIEEHCREAGVPTAMFAAMKPWLFTVSVMVIELQNRGVGLEGVDAHYQAKADAEGKPTHGLAPIGEHLRFITTLGAGQEDAMVRSTLLELDRTLEVIEQIINAWRTGDVEAIEATMVAELRDEFPKIHQELLVDRNRDWLPDIMAMFETPGVEYVLVGAGHFAGDEGLLALLRTEGVEIEPVTVD